MAENHNSSHSYSNNGACTQALTLEDETKVSYWMDEVESPTKLKSPVCEVEGYHSSDFSLSSPKGAFLSETKVESSKTIVIPFMTIGINNWEEDMASMKAML